MIITTEKLIMEGFLCRDENFLSEKEPGGLYFYPADTNFPHLEPKKTYKNGTGFWSGNSLMLHIPENDLHTEEGLYVGSKGLPDDISFDERRPRKAKIEMVITYESKIELENSYEDDNE